LGLRAGDEGELRKERKETMRKPRFARAALPVLVVFGLGLLGGSPAQANRVLLDEEVLPSATSKPLPTELIEGACGLAASSTRLYVSDYYHDAVKVFSPSGEFVSQITPVGASPEGPCGLALSPVGALYVNVWHQRVQRLLPSAQIFDAGHESTGVAVDPASGRVYVDDRTYVAVYEPSGAPVEVAGQPLRIGLDSLEDAYGVVVFEGLVYVPDAGSDTVKVFEADGAPPAPVATISHSFSSLVDAAVAVDPTNGNLVVADNTQPGFEFPGAALYEFDSSGTFLNQLACNPVDGEPSGLAFDAAGNLYVTNGNSAGANVFEYGPFTEKAVPTPSCAAAAAGGKASVAAPLAGAGDQPFAKADTPAQGAGEEASASEAVQRGGIRIALGGSFSPTRLPRKGSAGVRVSVRAKISSADGGEVPQLRRISIEINRAGRIDPTGLPVCRLDRIQPASNDAARAACGRSLVGQGSFSADVRLPEQSPFPSSGKVLAFNGTYKGRPAILAHVYGTEPVPTSYTLPFVIGSAKGTYGTALRASLPAVTGDAAAITGLSLTLGRSFRSHGRHRSYISAGCPAPAGLSRVPFPLARASFGFPGKTLRVTLNRSCRVR